MFKPFLSYCQRQSVKLSPCQERLAKEYFTDKEVFARSVVYCPRIAGQSLLFEQIKWFERRAAEDRKKLCNVGALTDD
jgi:hypothetical protein